MLYQMVLRLLLSAAGLGLAAVWLDGVHVGHPSTLFLAALLLAIANAVVRPVLILFTLPVTVLSLGLFLLVINAAMLGLVSALLGDFALDGFWSALGAWAIIALLQALGSLLSGNRRVHIRVERFPDE
ncbi:MAG: rane protein [Moraxellaceae bacterium]|jgi:putative membrane protein|nr:rane protein [Moraxellaceae bacterium]MDF3031926.1 rane protein [Moraxellaceae bacterium]